MFHFFLTGLVASAFWIFIQPSQAAASGQEVCSECHDEVVTAFAGTFHGKAWADMNKSAGCQSCHGSADKHKDDQSKTTIITFDAGSMQSASERSARCLACHQKSTNLTFWDMGAHKKNDVTCADCHDIHQPRSTVQQPTVCFTCHKDVRSDANKMSHHPIVEGKVSCSDCHNPHGTLTKHMIKAENNNQLCYTCHADKRGPWMWEHKPVEEDCMICHTSHGSRHETLLVDKIPNLCEECHANGSAGHEQVLINDSNAFTTTAGGSITRGSGRSCIGCHHAIHGSSNFKKSFSR